MTTEKLRVAVIGATGYGGVELLRFLTRHPQVEVTSVISSSSEDTPLSDHYPHLNQIIDDNLDGIDIPLIREKADLVFAATPHGVSVELVPQLLAAGLKVVDLSGDFRLKSAEAYELWYKKKAADPALLESAVYGLSEVYGADCKDASFISNPGCFPTAVLLGLIPAVANGWIDPATLIIDAKSGVSGAGRGVGLGFHYPEANENFKAYKVNQHQHTPEIEQILGWIAKKPVSVTFTTHLVPMTRGILATMYASTTQSRSIEDWIAMYREYYQGHSFIRVRDKGKWPATKEVWGSNYCDIGLSLDERNGRVTMISVIDNLVKGAAGQAIQNMNLMMGWHEALGLDAAPSYP